MLDNDWTEGIYSSEGYGRAVAVAESGQWVVLGSPETFRLPLILKEVDGHRGVFDAQSPYGYPGLLVCPTVKHEKLEAEWLEMLQGLRDRNVVSIFLRMTPWDVESLQVVRLLPGVEVTPRGPVVVIQTAGRLDDLWNGLSKGARNKVRKGRASGISAELRPCEPEDLTSNSPFRRLYAATMLRAGSRPEYLFPDEYYVALHAGLRENLVYGQATTAEGEVVAARLVLRDGKQYHALITGSSELGRVVHANNVLNWETIRYASEHGGIIFNLGGGARPGDGVFSYKASFGGQWLDFWTGSVIVDEGWYECLARRHAVALGASREKITACGFFPVYRTLGTLLA